MLALLVTGHGQFATGLNTGLEIIAGEQPNVMLVDFYEDDSVETLKERMDQALDKLKEYDGVLILSDLAGGNPFQTAVSCKLQRPDQAIEVIAGANLPLLIASAIASSTMASVFKTPRDLAEAMIPEGKKGIVCFETVTRAEGTEV